MVRQASGTLEEIPFAVPDAYEDPFDDGPHSPAPPHELPPAPAHAQPTAEYVAQETTLTPPMDTDWADDPPPAPQQLPSPALDRSIAAADAGREAGCDRVYNQRDCCADEERCQGARRLWQIDALSKISLDITPQLQPDETDPYVEESQRNRELAEAPVRTWRDRQGNVLVEGRLTNIKRGRLLVLDADNRIVKLPFHELCDDDLCFLTAWWKVPTECTFGEEAYASRAWQPTTFTWKATAACHKPLYFEDVQLERYGHSAGPIRQPILSGAHFFASLVTLPYQAGINPPWECSYALGYYRPGSCAPWLVPPVPLSLRGGLMQAGAIVGGVAIFP